MKRHNISMIMIGLIGILEGLINVISLGFLNRALRLWLWRKLHKIGWER